MKFIEFIKPEFKKIILTIILIIFPIYIIALQPSLSILIFLYYPVYIVSCYFGYFDCGPVWVPFYIAYSILLLVEILQGYLVSCLVVFAWNKIK